MNAVEIEQAVSALVAAPFDRDGFPYGFLEAFGNKATTLRRLRAGTSNASDISGGVLQRNNIHLAVCAPGAVAGTLAALRASPRTAAQKAKFILATDGEMLEAEDLAAGETLACSYAGLADHFGFFLPLAGITTISQIRNNPIDIKATGRLNRLYVELLRHNPDWASEARRHDLNQFLARLIFCFFAEDTGIFFGEQLFTRTLEQFTEARTAEGAPGSTGWVIAELFRAMDTPIAERVDAGLRPWADVFPYVNGGLFGGTRDIPRFSPIARSYLLHVGGLDWRRINPDIFGSMIQAVADEDERGALGLHYTSVPNILKVLNPLFLDDLRAVLESAGTNARRLLALRRRIAAIRVFDPACGSGNFLVIAYIHLREIEAEAIRRRDDPGKSWIRLENFYGIEIKDFPAEIARLALLIAEFQCDVRLIGQQEALIDVLPLKHTGRIVTGNALRLDWLEVCPPAKPSPVEHDLAGPTGRLALGDEGLAPEVDVETYICGNPPYVGSKWQSAQQRSDLAGVLQEDTKHFKTLDYVVGWMMRAAQHSLSCNSDFAFVSTNSICQGEQVGLLRPHIFGRGLEIRFVHRSFKWANLATHNAGVTCVIVGVGPRSTRRKLIMDEEVATQVRNIGPYLIEMENIFALKRNNSISGLPDLKFGNHPYYGLGLTMTQPAAEALRRAAPRTASYLRPLYGSEEFVNGTPRVCLWITDEQAPQAMLIPEVAERARFVAKARATADKDAAAVKLARTPYRFRDQITSVQQTIIVPRVSSENRPYLPVGLLDSRCILQDRAFGAFDQPLWNLALIASRLHWVWIGTVCVRMRTDFSYSNTLGWNTFPVPPLTETNKADLTRCAEGILLAREAHFPATIADLYDPETMPANLREAHERNDETLERIYIGRRFRNDTERLEKLFELYTRMTAAAARPAPARRARRPATPQAQTA